ncbi:MAG: (2Fe-2S) ferredoxin domain-containing protein [Verrucomicrobia bacterium]|nr:(2Fe-2S) ferredoxin domain-containing protein [Verrucomicrobiota bacterium]
MKHRDTPYTCHVFVCVNDRKGERQSCADGVGTAIKDLLKQKVEERGWKPQVRVSQSGCLGVCSSGPNVMIYPQKIWFGAVTVDDAEAILARVGELIGRADQ